VSFIVIEGLDGSGKSTQIKKLQTYLSDHSIAYEYLHFPRTETPLFGELIARFLRGEMGKLDEVDPYLVALIYACDRADAVPMLRNWMQSDKLLLIDRYVYSNVAFQCAKLSDPTQQETLRNWILHLELEHNQLPQPIVNLFLDVPFDFTISRLTNQRDGDDRGYLQGAADIHEADLDFQQRVRRQYLALDGLMPNFKVVLCADDKHQMLAPEVIFEKILTVLRNERIIL